MTKKYSTKRSLIASILALCMCFTSLIGTTFAWFTDSVTSSSNVIKSGNLDIVVEYTLDGENWNNLDGANDLFQKGLWEPGHTEVVALRIKNNGSLALNYTANMNIVEETVGKTADEQDIVLSDILTVTTITHQVNQIGDILLEMIFNGASNTDVSAADSFKASNILASDKELIAGDAHYVIITVDMPETIGNEANHDGTNIPTIEFGINVFATQATVESDTFGKDYDAGNAVYTVADANAAMLADNKDVMLVGANEPESVLEIPASYTGTLTIVNSRVKSVQAAGDANIAIQGSVVVNAKGSGLTTFAATSANGSAITAVGTLNISGSGNLTAIAADVNGAFGIGGMEVTKLTIKDVHIVDVKGSFVQPLFVNDTKYGKTEPEGGAAIGSGYNGAEINLINVTIDNAQGGSKAAGIGARYWTGVTINITDSIIKNVEGGNASAGIGGSRVSGEANESGTTINITNSIVTAKGGAYGAGIGSGYDTHCASKQPMCTINVTDSTINAEGGKYAAGIGTGYHNAALSGEIKNSTVNSVSGEKFYKDSYTQAQDIGFGVVDPDREGQQTDSKLIYNGVEIGIPAPGKVASVSSVEKLKAALEEGIPNIYLESDVQTDTVLNVSSKTVINGNGYMISRTDGFTDDVFLVKSGASLTLEDTVVDGGAVWVGSLSDGAVQNASVKATGNLIEAEANAKIILNEGAILQNNDGTYAVNLGTRIGATLTMNGGEIMYNRSEAGAVWGGGHITINSGKINNNMSTGSAGAIRMVSSCNLTMNSGELSNNTAAGDGGAIWGYGSSTYNFNGGSMSGNVSAGTGGAIYTGTYSVINISGDFELCDNKATNSGAIRLTDHTSLNMTGGKISGNTQNGESNAFNTWNNTISITGGSISDNISYVGGLGLTIGTADIDGVIAYDLSTNHNTAYLTADFNSFKFTVDETDANFAHFNFKPAADYVYTEGDEAKLVCMNEGYETYWDAENRVFKLQVTN